MIPAVIGMTVTRVISGSDVMVMDSGGLVGS